MGNGVNAFFMNVPDLWDLEVPAHAEFGVGECLQSFGNPVSFINRDGRGIGQTSHFKVIILYLRLGIALYCLPVIIICRV